MNDSLLEQAKKALASADAILIGAGAGLSTAAGFTYAGKRFTDNFSDFIVRYGLTDMYSAGFYPFPGSEERWAFWSRHIWLNRYQDIPGSVYNDLHELVKDKDYFVLTTNVDHCFQKTGFDKKRLFYTQGDYGLWQCSIPCHKRTYDNYEQVKKMVAEQSDMRIPADLIPRCPVCGSEMTMNLRIDRRFVEDEGWHAARLRYQRFAARRGKMVYLELGVGENTPVIIKYPFWEMTAQNPQATYISVNLENEPIPEQIESQAIAINADIGQTVAALNRA